MSASRWYRAWQAGGTAALVSKRPAGWPRRLNEEQRTRLEAELDAAHQQLGRPIVLVWDNLNTHLSRAMRARLAARDWLTVYRLPAYVPELNPAEGLWANLKTAWATSWSMVWTPSTRRSGPG